MFKALMPFELVFVYGVRLWSGFIHLHVTLQFLQQHLLKRLFLSLLYFSTTLL